MTLDDLDAALQEFAGSSASYPFGEWVRVHKVGGKIFAFVSENSDPLQISLKCDPEIAEELREQYPDVVTPGYHLNKRHWNTVTLNSSVADDDLRDWIAHSYDLVFRSLTKAAQREINENQLAASAATD